MYAHLVWFDRPRTAAELAAADFASANRIAPALATVPGLLDYYELRRPDGSGVVIGFGESEAALDAVRAAILATELLPGEDPALLPGPDRVEIYPVLRHNDTAAIYAEEARS
ncbi:hypothetical protein [Nocardia asteroides]|uniref:YCII-related domain-containing protein n=2 Tax=Nocardia asteroides TaxID=1824 RepID=U5E9G1_NOCAS|nr:hypothetical protein [Nocardia asteroides]TLF69116.1 hypothetical protein FEK33_01960 [Nocardia asteroides NBRC 15531]UGT48593.1 hypothetical protein LT345_29800 [Nocardia asteroides]SFL64790.1 hypothetical protein SAMN05444423_101400 [Nocardia asteroides]VEG31912.1 Uncharacterised protein [Nocardia asteroides]GAD83071.1 hypothetical protein NCAST_17_00530 [Nocardia asteroides NBRC 15531]